MPQLVAPVPLVVVDERPHDVAAIIATVSNDTIEHHEKAVTICARIIAITPMQSPHRRHVLNCSLSVHWCPTVAIVIVLVF